MSLKAWAGLLGEFGRQSEAYASRQQELEDKRMEEERENRRMAALLAKEQALETWRANRPLSEREQAVFDEDLAGKKSRRTYEEARAQYYSGGGEQVQALAEQIAEERNISIEEALPLAQALVPAAGRRGSSTGGSGATGTGGALKLGNADLVKDEKDEQTGKTFKRYLNGAKVPDYSEDEFVQIATERANAWRKQKGKGLMNAEPSEEDTSAFMAEQVKALKEANAAQHKAAFEESKRVFSEFNAQPGGLIAPQGKAGQPEDTGKQPSLTDKIGKPNANAGIDFEAALQSMREAESNNKDFTEEGEFVTSKKGAQGKSQVMPKTAADPGFGIKPANLSGSKEQQAAELNRVGKEYLGKMIEKYDGNLATAYTAYNMGPGATDKWLKSGADPADLPKETRDYVANTMAKYESYVSKKSNVLDGQEPQGEPENDLAARVKARAAQYKASAQQQPEKKGLLADPSPSPFGGFEAAAGAGMTPDEEAQGGESFGTTVGKAARGAQEGAEAVGKGALYLRDQGEKVGKLDWWKEQIAKLKDWRDESLEAAKSRAGINDQVLEAMYAEQAKKGVPVEQFIKDFLEGYSGKKEKVSGRPPTAVTGVRG